MEDDFDDEDMEERREKMKEDKKLEKKDKAVIGKSYNKPQLLERVRGNPWMVSTFVLGALALILILTNFSLGGVTGNVGKDVASANLMKFLSENVNGNITLLDVEKENGMYRVDVEYQGQTIPVYVTMNGKYTASSLQPLLDESSTSPTSTEIPKTDKPSVELFVMSFCPYGNRGENTMVPVYNLLKDKIDFNVYYIVGVSGNTVSSLHGQPEVDENEREACVLTDYGLDAWWKFVIYVNNNCGSDGSCWKDAALQSGVDVAKLTKCVQEKGLNLMTKSEQASNAAGASGSPTLVINGVQSDAVYQYGNADAYKQAICSAFNTAPEECSTQLQSVADSGATGNCA
jgi:hypothetical protein